jgi:hypothetical protein
MFNRRVEALNLALRFKLSALEERPHQGGANGAMVHLLTSFFVEVNHFQYKNSDFISLGPSLGEIWTGFPP